MAAAIVELPDAAAFCDVADLGAISKGGLFAVDVALFGDADLEAPLADKEPSGTRCEPLVSSASAPMGTRCDPLALPPDGGGAKSGSTAGDVDVTAPGPVLPV